MAWVFSLNGKRFLSPPLSTIYPTEELIHYTSITTPGHKAQSTFIDDVNSTYARIRTRTAEIANERAANSAHDGGGVEQIQLHAVEPGSQIYINIPQPDSSEDVEQQARIIFERFPPGLQRALESKSLDRVNEVLGKMSVSEAEEVVEQMGEAGMLSMEKGVIDGTTEKGQQRLKELEKEAQDHVHEYEEVDTEVPLKELEIEALKDREAMARREAAEAAGTV